MIEITPAKKERTPHTGMVLRTIGRQVFYFPDDVDPRDYEVVGQVLGFAVHKREHLTKAHFDQIQFINKTTHPKKGGDFVNAIGYRTKDKSYEPIIMERIVN